MVFETKLSKRSSVVKAPLSARLSKNASGGNRPGPPRGPKPFGQGPRSPSEAPKWGHQGRRRALSQNGYGTYEYIYIYVCVLHPCYLSIKLVMKRYHGMCSCHNLARYLQPPCVICFTRLRCLGDSRMTRGREGVESGRKPADCRLVPKPGCK
jgi:hypothetical protein